MDCKFTAGEIKACLSHASKDPTRFHLNGVHAGNGYLCATDGHRLIQIRRNASDRGELLLRADAVAGIARMPKARDVRVNGVVEAYSKDGAALASLPTAAAMIDAVFPPVDQVMPDMAKYVTIGVNPDYLADAAAACRAAGVGKDRGVKLHFDPTDPLAPIVVTAEGESTESATEIKILIMPRALADRRAATG